MSPKALTNLRPVHSATPTGPDAPATTAPGTSGPRLAAAARTIGLSGLAAGVLDATAGVVVYTLVLQRLSVVGVLQWIASGALGPAAFDGGLATAAAGAVFHFMIAFAFAAAYYAAHPFVGVLREHRVFSGLAYGALVWAVMNLIVLPLSNVPPAPFEPAVALTALVWHMALVGLPIALVVHRGRGAASAAESCDGPDACECAAY